MSKKLLICPYFGTPPDWWPLYRETEIPLLKRQGYDMLVDWNEFGFNMRCKEVLGIEPPPMYGTGKIWDFRPALGLLYADELKDYDWWGHTDFDCVYGRVREFVTEEKLEGCQIYTDCAHGYLAGPWTLYRNSAIVNELFMGMTNWQEHLLSPEPTAWVERSFTTHALAEVAVTIEGNHAYEMPQWLRRGEDDRLIYGTAEIPMFHFRRSKVWPL